MLNDWQQHKKNVRAANTNYEGSVNREPRLAFLRRVFSCELYQEKKDSERFHFCDPKLAATNITHSGSTYYRKPFWEGGKWM